MKDENVDSFTDMQEWGGAGNSTVQSQQGRLQNFTGLYELTENIIQHILGSLSTRTTVETGSGRDSCTSAQSSRGGRLQGSSSPGRGRGIQCTEGGQKEVGGVTGLSQRQTPRAINYYNILPTTHSRIHTLTNRS